MNNTFIKILFLGSTIAIGSCNSSKMGKIIYGKDGKIESGTGSTRCTHPSKTYAKGVEFHVKNSFDSLAVVPKANIDFALSQTVTRLTDYSSDGLDLELILFQVCEISNNRGLTSPEINSLTQIATDAWQRKSSHYETGNNNHFITGNGNIVGVNGDIIGDVVKKPTNEDLQLVFSKVPNHEDTILVVGTLSNNDYKYAEELKIMLSKNGYKNIVSCKNCTFYTGQQERIVILPVRYKYWQLTAHSD